MDPTDLIVVGGMVEIFAGVFCLLAILGGFKKLSFGLLVAAVVGLGMLIYGGVVEGIFPFGPLATNVTANATPTIACSWANNSTASVLICPR